MMYDFQTPSKAIKFFVSELKISKGKNGALFKTRVGLFYLQLLSSYILSNHGSIVLEKDWDMPNTWDVPDYSTVLTSIVKKALEGKCVESVIRSKLLSRNSITNSLDLPQTIKKEMHIILTEFEQLNSTLDLRYAVGCDLIDSIISNEDKIDTIHGSIWDIYFQMIDMNPNMAFQNPITRDAIKEEVSINLKNNILRPIYNKTVKYMIDDRIIMCVNGSYSDIITMCLQAVKLYQAKLPIGTSLNPTIDSIHDQIVKMELSKRRELSELSNDQIEETQ